MADLHLRLLIITAIVATSSAAKAPAPSPTPKVNLTAILEKGGQFTSFIRLLDVTQVGDQVDNQISNAGPNAPGMTVFAPTDNAFQNLKSGTINSLSTQNQVKLVLYHVLPKFYALTDFQTASNPVQTQASTDDGKLLGLTIDYLGVNSVNVTSTKNVTTQVNNALSSKFPLAVYQVDKVLLPEELFVDAKAPKSSPVSASPVDKPKTSANVEAPAATHEKNAAYGLNRLGFSFVGLLGFFTMEFLF